MDSFKGAFHETGIHQDFEVSFVKKNLFCKNTLVIGLIAVLTRLIPHPMVG